MVIRNAVISILIIAVCGIAMHAQSPNAPQIPMVEFCDLVRNAADSLRFANDSSKPSGWAIVTRAAENANLGDTVFVISASRRFIDDPNVILRDFKSALMRHCANGVGQAHTIWLGKDSADVVQLAADKHDLVLSRFQDDAGAGLQETNWYFQKLKTESLFYPTHGDGRFHAASRCYLLVHDSQLEVPENDEGLLSTRQELITWAYNEKGEPQPYGGVTVDCIRMCFYNFALNAFPLTKEEKRIAQLPDELKPESLRALLGTPAFPDAYWAQQHALNQIRRKEEGDERKQMKPFGRFFGRPVQHLRWRRRRC